MKTVEAVWDNGADRDVARGWKYKLPGVQGFVTPARKATSIVSPNAAIVREVKEIAFALNVKLPERWELMMRR